jgi:hypothetical protein
MTASDFEEIATFLLKSASLWDGCGKFYENLPPAILRLLFPVKRSFQTAVGSDRDAKRLFVRSGRKHSRSRQNDQQRENGTDALKHNAERSHAGPLGFDETRDGLPALARVNGWALS